MGGAVVYELAGGDYLVVSRAGLRHKIQAPLKSDDPRVLARILREFADRLEHASEATFPIADRYTICDGP